MEEKPIKIARWAVLRVSKFPRLMQRLAHLHNSVNSLPCDRGAWCEWPPHRYPNYGLLAVCCACSRSIIHYTTHITLRVRCLSI